MFLIDKAKNRISKSKSLVLWQNNSQGRDILCLRLYSLKNPDIVSIKGR